MRKTLILLALVICSSNLVAQEDSVQYHRWKFLKIGLNTGTGIMLFPYQNENLRVYHEFSLGSFIPDLQLGYELSKRFFVTTGFEYKQLQNAHIEYNFVNNDGTSVRRDHYALQSDNLRYYGAMNFYLLRILQSEQNKAEIGIYLNAGVAGNHTMTKVYPWQEAITYDPNGNKYESLKHYASGYYKFDAFSAMAGFGFCGAIKDYSLDLIIEHSRIFPTPEYNTEINDETMTQPETIDHLFDEVNLWQLSSKSRLKFFIKLGVRF